MKIGDSIIKGISKGDEKAYAELFDTCYAQLHELAYTYVLEIAEWRGRTCVRLPLFYFLRFLLGESLHLGNRCSKSCWRTSPTPCVVSEVREK